MKIDWLSERGHARMASKGETLDQAWNRALEFTCRGDHKMKQFLLQALQDGWFSLATPQLVNPPKGKWVDGEWTGDQPGMSHTISCYAFSVADNVVDQIEKMAHSAALGIAGGGKGVYMGIRAPSNKARGAVALTRLYSEIDRYFQQTSDRRGAATYHIDVDNAELLELLKMREPDGDVTKKIVDTTTSHFSIVLTDDFMHAVQDGADWDLRCKHSGKKTQTIKARELWERFMEQASVTGEPFLVWKDTANKALPEAMKPYGEITNSNLCQEIFDICNEVFTFVCSLSSLNLSTYGEWAGNEEFIYYIVKFLDNSLQNTAYFIQKHDKQSEWLKQVVNSIQTFRNIGIGMMGFHTFVQSKGLPIEHFETMNWNHRIIKFVTEAAESATKRLAQELGGCKADPTRRNCLLTAIAPNATSAEFARQDVCKEIKGNVSPGIEPYYSNLYKRDTSAGVFEVVNPVFYQYCMDKGLDWDTVRQDILKTNGSIQHLEYFSEEEKEVFKTSWEINQFMLVDLAAARQYYMDKAGGHGQSINLFFPPGASKELVTKVHFRMWEKGIKSRYYLRQETETSKLDYSSIENFVTWKDSDCIGCEG